MGREQWLLRKRKRERAKEEKDKEKEKEKEKQDEEFHVCTMHSTTLCVYVSNMYIYVIHMYMYIILFCCVLQDAWRRESEDAWWRESDDAWWEPQQWECPVAPVGGLASAPLTCGSFRSCASVFLLLRIHKGKPSQSAR